MAATAYASALSEAPKLAHIWVQYGHMLREAGRRNDARDAYEQAVALKPQGREPYTLLMSLARTAGDRAALFRHALALFRLEAEDRRAQATLLQASSIGDPNHAKAIDDVARQLGLAPRHVAETPPPTAVLYIDVGDLIAHFVRSRLPSGLQRVEIEVARAALAMPDYPLTLCCWSMVAAVWKPLSGETFLALVDAAESGSDEADWHRQLSFALYSLAIAPALRFPAGSVLLDLGMAWGDPTHHPAVMREKALGGLRFAAIACDVIPLTRPDEVPRDIVSACADWLDGLAASADTVIAISSATRDDVVRVSAGRGRPIPAERVGVVPLDATFDPVRSGGSDALARYRLRNGEYALYVSTVEPRKNHLAAFETWRLLAAERGLPTPDLVCVGRLGWRSETVAAALAADPALAARVHMLQGVSDEALAALYDGCAFVFYPSLQEGWGLPVTEALAYGKVPVVGDNSSLPEAGGAFAIYVDASSPASMAATIAALICDPAARVAREEAIRDGFRPRGWGSIAEDMIAAARGGSKESVTS